MQTPGTARDVSFGGLPLPATTPVPPRDFLLAPASRSVGGGVSAHTTSREGAPPSTLVAQAYNAWRGFIRRVQAASSPSESVTGGSGTGGDISGTGGSVICTGRRAENAAREVAEKDFAETCREARRTAHAARRVDRDLHASTTVQPGDNNEDEDEGEEEAEGEYAVVAEKIVLDQGFSHSDGWARRFRAGPAFHSSAPTDDDPVHPTAGSKSHSVTEGLHREDEFGDAAAGCWGKTRPGTWLRWRLWPAMYRFFEMPFITGKEELAYQKESWYNSKRIALWGSSFYYCMAITSLAFRPDPIDVVNRTANYALGPLFAVVLPFLIIYDWPKKKRVFYQFWLFAATWGWPVYALVDLRYCGYYTPNRGTCGSKEFTGVMYSAIAIPTVAVMGLGMTRIFYATGTCSIVTLIAIFAAPHSPLWIRNVINLCLFSVAVLVVHYMKEQGDRRVWSLRDQLKRQYRQTQKAQVAEAKAADSKRRFTSYIFHEVRVPLNNALLSLQNLENAGVFGQADQHDTDVEWHALVGSLVMMQKVLNDVLDFSRMDAGRFETVRRPFYFHRSLRSLLHSFESAAQSKGLEFSAELDPRIDDIMLETTKAAARARGDEGWHELTEGLAVGDEMRLRQVVTNLCSNATKFTEAGGSVWLRTRLIFPVPPTPVLSRNPSSCATAIRERLSTHLDQRQSSHGPIHTVVVRIEVQDTGAGISATDLSDSRLFSPFVQTSLGVLQGGKGTGLGLALVRSIVKLSKGRLGVISAKGRGSTFWIELPLGVSQATTDHLSSPTSDIIDLSRATFSPCAKTAQRPSEGEKEATALENTGKSEDLRSAPELIVTGGAATPDDFMGKFGLPVFTSPEGQPGTTSTQESSAGSYIHRPPLNRSDDSKSINSSSGGSSEQGNEKEQEAGVGASSSEGTMIPMEKTREGVGAKSEPNAGSLSSGLAAAIADSHLGNGDVLAQLSTLTAKTPESTAGDAGIVPAAPISLGGDSLGAQTAPVPRKTPENAMRSENLPPASSSAGTASQTSGTHRLGDGLVVPPLRILLVDDDNLTRKLMSRMLTRQGHLCAEAVDGHDALVKLGAGVEDDPDYVVSPESAMQQEHRFDLVMLDNYMPKLSGVTVIQRMRRLGRRDMVCGCTANAEKMDQQEYRDAGVDGLLTKPINQRDLMRVCAEASARRLERLESRAGDPRV